MDPIKFAGQGNGDPMSFTDAGRKGKPVFERVTPDMPEPRKTKVEYFNRPGHYQEWMEKNPYIEVINVINSTDWIVLTYKEPF